MEKYLWKLTVLLLVFGLVLAGCDDPGQSLRPSAAIAAGSAGEPVPVGEESEGYNLEMSTEGNSNGGGNEAGGNGSGEGSNGSGEGSNGSGEGEIIGGNEGGGNGSGEGSNGSGEGEIIGGNEGGGNGSGESSNGSGESSNGSGEGSNGSGEGSNGSGCNNCDDNDCTGCEPVKKDNNDVPEQKLEDVISDEVLNNIFNEIDNNGNAVIPALPVVQTSTVAVGGGNIIPGVSRYSGNNNSFKKIIFKVNPGETTIVDLVTEKKVVVGKVVAYTEGNKLFVIYMFFDGTVPKTLSCNLKYNPENNSNSGVVSFKPFKDPVLGNYSLGSLAYNGGTVWVNATCTF